MSPTSRRPSILWRGLRTRGPMLALIVVVLLSATVIAVGLRASPTAPSRPMLVSSGSWAPFVGPELPDGGPVAKLVVEILNRSGYSPEIRHTSWSLAEKQVTSGASHAVFPLVGSESRRAGFLLSDSLLDIEYVLFYDRRRGEPKISAPADLAGLRVGGIAGYDYWKELESAVSTFVTFDSPLEGFQALADGRVDVLAEGLLPGQAVLTGTSFAGDASNFGYLQNDSPLVHSVEGLYFMMADTPEAAIVMKRFNEVLAKLRSSGEYKEIVPGFEPAEGRQVTLIPVGDTGLVELLDDNGRLALLAPQGTRAQVLVWPREFVASPGASRAPILVKVKVVNGPAQGRVLHVDARALLIDAEGK
ncbi:substrate-binding periplasmic protein [Micromonospora polyrhachis]|uniref:ABC-type amino acid transport substrate-binding protein n=1 Tax=Micromonospora polyrhachis TaxID=1282883 RepID=A0A7W7WMY2_9ACTN|nr:transporter substrate-binding domain-containing protein [Micromonospora polyrhachis]MBB4957062.1 ABC-type amino acid transport substrate-binding protein [Micromonospora polyrhachis]